MADISVKILCVPVAWKLVAVKQSSNMSRACAREARRAFAAGA